jgi:hypothetical protein
MQVCFGRASKYPTFKGIILWFIPQAPLFPFFGLTRLWREIRKVMTTGAVGGLIMPYKGNFTDPP